MCVCDDALYNFLTTLQLATTTTTRFILWLKRSRTLCAPSATNPSGAGGFLSAAAAWLHLPFNFLCARPFCVYPSVHRNFRNPLTSERVELTLAIAPS